MHWGYVLVFLVLCLFAFADGSKFPPPDQLPARPELPDPLVMLNGEKVQTRDRWEALRRPELKELFQRYMYGYFPPPPDRLSSRVLHEDAKAFSGKATLRELEIAF